MEKSNVTWMTVTSQRTTSHPIVNAVLCNDRWCSIDVPSGAPNTISAAATPPSTSVASISSTAITRLAKKYARLPAVIVQRSALNSLSVRRRAAPQPARLISTGAVGAWRVLRLWRERARLLLLVAGEPAASSAHGHRTSVRPRYPARSGPNVPSAGRIG